MTFAGSSGSFPVIILGIRELDDQSERGERIRLSHVHHPQAAMVAIHHDMIHGLLLFTRISGFQSEKRCHKMI